MLSTAGAPPWPVLLNLFPRCGPAYTYLPPFRYHSNSSTGKYTGKAHSAKERGTPGVPLIDAIRLRFYCVLSRGNAHIFFDNASNRVFTRGANNTFDFLAFAEKNQRRNSLDAVSLRGGCVVINV